MRTKTCWEVPSEGEGLQRVHGSAGDSRAVQCSFPPSTSPSLSCSSLPHPLLTLPAVFVLAPPPLCLPPKTLLGRHRSLDPFNWAKTERPAERGLITCCDYLGHRVRCGTTSDCSPLFPSPQDRGWRHPNDRVERNRAGGPRPRPHQLCGEGMNSAPSLHGGVAGNPTRIIFRSRRRPGRAVRDFFAFKR